VRPGGEQVTRGAVLTASERQVIGAGRRLMPEIALGAATPRAWQPWRDLRDLTRNPKKMRRAQTKPKKHRLSMVGVFWVS